MAMDDLRKNDFLLYEDVKYFLNPKYVFVPIKNADMGKILVKDRSYVYKNDKIVDSDIPRYSSISGTVLGVKNMPFKDGDYESIVIENDFKENVRKRVSAKKRIKDYTSGEVINLLTKFGIDIELFGKGRLYINTLDKNIPINKYIYKDMVEKLFYTIDKLVSVFDYEMAYVLVRDEDKPTKRALTKEARYHPFIKIKLVDDNSIDVGNNTLIDINLVYKIYKLLKRRTPISEVYFTILGDGVSVNNIFYVKKYSLISELFFNNCDFLDKSVDVYLDDNNVSSLKYVIDDNMRYIQINKKKVSELGLK